MTGHSTQLDSGPIRSRDVTLLVRFNSRAERSAFVSACKSGGTSAGSVLRDHAVRFTAEAAAQQPELSVDKALLF